MSFAEKFRSRTSAAIGITEVVATAAPLILDKPIFALVAAGVSLGIGAFEQVRPRKGEKDVHTITPVAHIVAAFLFVAAVTAGEYGAAGMLIGLTSAYDSAERYRRWSS